MYAPRRTTDRRRRYTGKLKDGASGGPERFEDSASSRTEKLGDGAS